MPINEMQNVTLKNITDIINISTGDPIEFFINVNQIAFNGWFYFFLLWIIAIILYIKAQKKEDQPLNNAMNVMAIATILSFILRVVYVTKGGMQWGLMTDFQLWMFPIATIILAAMIRFSSDS